MNQYETFREGTRAYMDCHYGRFPATFLEWLPKKEPVYLYHDPAIKSDVMKLGGTILFAPSPRAHARLCAAMKDVSDQFTVLFRKP